MSGDRSCDRPTGNNAPENAILQTLTEEYSSSETITRYVYECPAGTGRYEGDLERTCIDGNWSGTRPKCPDLCDLHPLYTAGYDVFKVNESDIISKLTGDTVLSVEAITLVCNSGTKPTSDSFDFALHNCTTIEELLNDDVKCERADNLPHPRFTITAGISPKPYVFSINDNNVSVVHLEPHTALNFSVNTNYLQFKPRGHFSVGDNFTWYAFVRVPSSESRIPIISWYSSNNGEPM